MDNLESLNQLDRIEYRQKKEEIEKQSIGFIPLIVLFLMEISRQIYVNSLIQLLDLSNGVINIYPLLFVAGIYKFLIIGAMITFLIIYLRRAFKMRRDLGELYFEYFDLEIKPRKNK